MPITDRFYRHYRCDAPGCTAEGDIEGPTNDDANFEVFHVDWGHADKCIRGVLCKEHGKAARAALEQFGLKPEGRWGY